VTPYKHSAQRLMSTSMNHGGLHSANLALFAALALLAGACQRESSVQHALESRTFYLLTIATPQGDIEITLNNDRATNRLVRQVATFANRGGYDGCRLQTWGDVRVHVFFAEEGNPDFVQVTDVPGKVSLKTRLDKGDVALMHTFSSNSVVCIDHLVIGLGRDCADESPLPVIGTVKSGMHVLTDRQGSLEGVRIRARKTGPLAEHR